MAFPLLETSSGFHSENAGMYLPFGQDQINFNTLLWLLFKQLLIVSQEIVYVLLEAALGLCLYNRLGE